MLSKLFFSPVIQKIKTRRTRVPFYADTRIKPCYGAGDTHRRRAADNDGGQAGMYTSTGAKKTLEVVSGCRPVSLTRTNRLHGGGKRALVAADRTVPFTCACGVVCTCVRRSRTQVYPVRWKDRKNKYIANGNFRKGRARTCRASLRTYTLYRLGDGPKCCDDERGGAPNVM